MRLEKVEIWLYLISPENDQHMKKRRQFVSLLTSPIILCETRTKITVNQAECSVLCSFDELLSSQLASSSSNNSLWLRIYFHQLNYLQLSDKRPPHVVVVVAVVIVSSFLLFFALANPKNCEWMNSRLPLAEECLLHVNYYFVPTVVNAERWVDDINFFIQQWNDFFAFPTWWWI